MSGYQKTIKDLLKKAGCPKMDPRHVEGYMRLRHGVLDSLSQGEFQAEVNIAIKAVQEGGTELAESNARSYGL